MSLKEDNHPKELLLTVLIYEKLFVSQVFSQFFKQSRFIDIIIQILTRLLIL